MNSLASAPISWNYDFLHAPQAGTLDFLSTALHEIGHTIGFISGIDTSQTEDNSFIRGVLDYFGYESTASVTETTVMDLFRYSVESAAQEITDLTLGTAAYFSLDGTATELALSTGEDYQGSHWIDNTQENGLGIMNPTLGLGERWSISSNDLLVMEAIGWDINYTTELDLQALSNDAQSQVQTAWIEDRTTDVDGILNTEAYNWSSRSSGASSSSFWWSSRSSGASSSSFWQVGYYSTCDEASGELVVVAVSPTENTQESSESTSSDSNWWWNTSWNWDSNSSWGDSSWNSSSYWDKDDDDDNYSSRNNDNDNDEEDDDGDSNWSSWNSSRNSSSYWDKDNDGDNYSSRNNDNDDDDEDDDD